ncbi:MAG: hypothetical protein AB7O52_04455 [Planctomycetota bacterium]
MATRPITDADPTNAERRTVARPSRPAILARRVRDPARGITAVLLAASVALVWFHEVGPSMYEYPPAKPFSGNRWYNPYEPVDGSRWLRACLHAHSEAWGGFTDGDAPVRAVWEAYRNLGTDVVGISNYQSIRPRFEDEELYFSVYEHGFGIGQHHFTVLGAAAVSWFDFPLYKRLRHKQAVIDHLRARCEFLVINHPAKNGAFAGEDLAFLSGYDAVEIATGSCRPDTRGRRGERPVEPERKAAGPELWDTALSSGHAVWGMCGDDSHALADPHDLGRGWVAIDVGSSTSPPTEADVLESLRAGRFYGAWTRRDQQFTTRVESVVLHEPLLRVALTEPVTEIRFIGQGGQLLHQASATQTAEYTVRPDDTYVRVEAVIVDAFGNEGVTLFLNPLYRYENDPRLAATATKRPVSTWVARGVWTVLAGISLALTWRWHRTRVPRHGPASYSESGHRDQRERPSP